MFSSCFRWRVKASLISLRPSKSTSTSTTCSLSPSLNSISGKKQHKHNKAHWSDSLLIKQKQRMINAPNSSAFAVFKFHTGSQINAFIGKRPLRIFIICIMAEVARPSYEISVTALHWECDAPRKYQAELEIQWNAVPNVWQIVSVWTVSWTVWFE